MDFGVSLPQGCDREYIGLEAADAWQRTVDVARDAEALGFESVWINDHFQVDPPLIDAPIFEPFVELTGLAMATAAGPPRPSRAGGGLPERGAHGQDDLHARRRQRRAHGAGHRRRLEGGRVAGLRLRVPRGARAAGHPGGPSRGHHPDAPARACHLRGSARQRPRRHPPAQGSAGPAHPHHGRRQRTQGHVAPGGAIRR